MYVKCLIWAKTHNKGGKKWKRSLLMIEVNHEIKMIRPIWDVLGVGVSPSFITELIYVVVNFSSI